MGEVEKDEQVVEFIAQEEASTFPARRPRISETPHSFDNQVTKVTTESEDAAGKLILKSIPPESQITLVRFEGPNIALYTKKPKFALTELTYYLSSLS